MSRRLLQGVNVALALWILFRAGLTLLEGPSNPMYGTEVLRVPLLDSNLRFLGGIGVAMGLILLWVTPAIQARTDVFRVIWVCRLGGGFGRLISLGIAGVLPTPVMVFTVSEILFIPFLLYWQSTLAGPARRATTPAAGQE